MNLDGYRNEIAPIELAGKTARLECAQCGARQEWSVNQKLPSSDIVRKHFKTRGWSLAKRVKCPACSNQRKEPRAVSTVTPIKSPAPDPRAQRRDAHALIELYFDIPGGRYKEGYSDERIAKETGIAPAWVKQRREDEFGPLKQPDELADMRAQLAEAEKAVAEIKARFDKLCVKQGWAA